MDTQDGQEYIKNTAQFVRNNEKALANALLRPRPITRHGSSSSVTASSSTTPSGTSATATTSLASAISLPYLGLGSSLRPPPKMVISPHHLFYLLSKFEELGIAVGPMNVRLESLHSETSPTNYVSFLSQAQRKKSRNSDRDSIHSVSSIRSVVSGMSNLWSNLGLGMSQEEKAAKQKLAIQADLRYLYSAFTKIPTLRLAPDRRSRLIAGYEEFPFDSAVPLFAFKNVTQLEVCDIDFRQFYGWDRLAENLTHLTVNRAGLDDVSDLLIHIVIDDNDKRRRKSAKVPPSPAQAWPTASPPTKHSELARSGSTPSSFDPIALKQGLSGSPQSSPMRRGGSAGSLTAPPRNRKRSVSPGRPVTSRHDSLAQGKSTPNIRRSSGSSGSSLQSTPRGSSSNLPTLESMHSHRWSMSSSTLLRTGYGYLPTSKWRFLRHLNVADNGMTSISAAGLAPLANTLRSLDVSSNLFTEVPESLATLTSLRALNLSNCMISSLHSLIKSPLPAIAILNLRGNRLTSLAGIERLPSLERLDLRDNKLTDPTEMARLTSLPEMQDIYIKSNPFVKTHTDYRVTVFNLFRKTPGYTNDVTIDNDGPSYQERKQLVDRVPEPEGVPIIKPLPPLPVLDALPDVKPDYKIEHIVPRVHATHHRSKSDYTHGSQKKRKTTKRRIVELSQNEALQHSHSELNSVTRGSLERDEAVFGAPQNIVASPEISDPFDDIPHANAPSPAQDVPQLPALRPILIPPTTIAGVDTPPKSPPQFDMSNELYKKKIEALKQDFGNNWLSALGDESWDAHAHPPAHHFSNAALDPPVALRPDIGRNVSSGISSGRTLG